MSLFASNSAFGPVRGRLALRLSASAVLLTLGCEAGLPRRRAGSDITLPRSAAERALSALGVPCARRGDSLATRERSPEGCGYTDPDSVLVRDPQRAGTRVP